MVKKKSFIFALTIFIIVILDQLTKLAMKNYWPELVTTNTGSLFGLFKGSVVVLAWFSVIVIGVFLFYYDKIQKSPKIAQVGSGLIVGGAIGNLIDRFAYGAVIDFIDLLWWPSFNIADSAISIGVLLLIIFFWKAEKK